MEQKHCSRQTGMELNHPSIQEPTLILMMIEPGMFSISKDNHFEVEFKDIGYYDD